MIDEQLYRGTAMKKVILAFAIVLASSGAAFAQTYVNGYYRNDGTYVAPHYRSSPNNTVLDNYSTKGNVNPFTGQAGTKNPYPSGNSYLGGSSSGSGGIYGSGQSGLYGSGQKKGGGIYGLD